MKKLLYTAAVAMAICFASCEKYLDRPQAGTIPETEAIANETDIQRLLNDAYAQSNNNVVGGKLQFISDLLGDQANGILLTEDNGEIFGRRTSIFGGYKNDFYRDAYAVIQAANRAIVNLDKAGANRNALEGQALFLRAWMHFEMVRLFAQPFGATTDNSHLGIPLRTDISIESVQRSTVKAVYDQVIADLTAADSKLPDQAPLGTPSKMAAKALLAKVYFQANNFQQAYNWSNQVVSSNRFQLDTFYRRRFTDSIGTPNGTREAIFYFKNVNGNLEPGGELRNRYRSDGGNFQPGSDFHVTNIFFGQAAVAGDARAAWYQKNADGYNMVTKYNRNQFDLPIIHLTEIVLIRAESGAETGATNLPTAIADINNILRRAYGAGSSQLLSTSASAQQVIVETRRQRELEMIAEGNRVQEIKRLGARLGNYTDRRGAPWNCNGLALQFPNGEQAANLNFVMNPEGGCN